MRCPVCRRIYAIIECPASHQSHAVLRVVVVFGHGRSSDRSYWDEQANHFAQRCSSRDSVAEERNVATDHYIETKCERGDLNP